MSRRNTNIFNTTITHGDLPEPLTDVFRCFICMEKLQDAHLCPHCSKLCCYLCISRWLTEQRRQCPHCRAPLHINELVNCRWFQDIACQMEFMQQICVNANANKFFTKEKDQCQTHDEKLSVYCCTCKSSICHQCALWGGKHTEHTFKKLDTIYKAHLIQVQQGMGYLKDRLASLIAVVQKVERNVENVRNDKDIIAREIKSTVEYIIARLENQLKMRLVTLMRHKGSVVKETDQLEHFLKDIEMELNRSSHAQLIEKCPKMLQIIEKVKETPVDKLYAIPSTPEFDNEIVPRYDLAVFKIQPFTHYQREGSPIYSDPLNTNGLQWRLKVYPNGNGAVRAEFLSIFLELSVGLPESSKYEYRIQMVHPSGSKIVQREFVSNFEVGECWGYNRFFRLDLLATEGYHNKSEDSLELQFQVRPSNYFQKCRDQQWYINQLLMRQSHLEAEIKDIKSKLNKESYFRDMINSTAETEFDWKINKCEYRSKYRDIENIEELQGANGGNGDPLICSPYTSPEKNNNRFQLEQSTDESNSTNATGQSVTACCQAESLEPVNDSNALTTDTASKLIDQGINKASEALEDSGELLSLSFSNDHEEHLLPNTFKNTIDVSLRQDKKEKDCEDVNSVCSAIHPKLDLFDSYIESTIRKNDFKRNSSAEEFEVKRSSEGADALTNVLVPKRDVERLDRFLQNIQFSPETKKEFNCTEELFEHCNIPKGHFPTEDKNDVLILEIERFKERFGGGVPDMFEKKNPRCGKLLVHEKNKELDKPSKNLKSFNFWTNMFFSASPSCESLGNEPIDRKHIKSKRDLNKFFNTRANQQLDESQNINLLDEINLVDKSKSTNLSENCIPSENLGATSLHYSVFDDLGNQKSDKLPQQNFEGLIQSLSKQQSEDTTN